MDSLLKLLMGQWTTYILWVLNNQGPIRFGALKRAVPGVSAKVLTERLRILEDSGVIFREVLPTNPPQVNYGLTDRGKELSQILNELATVARRWAKEDGTLPEDAPNECTFKQEQAQ